MVAVAARDHGETAHTRMLTFNNANSAQNGNLVTKWKNDAPKRCTFVPARFEVAARVTLASDAAMILLRFGEVELSFLRLGVRLPLVGACRLASSNCSTKPSCGNSLRIRNARVCTGRTGGHALRHRVSKQCSRCAVCVHLSVRAGSWLDALACGWRHVRVAFAVTFCCDRARSVH